MALLDFLGNLAGTAGAASQYNIGRDQTNRADDRFDRQSIFDTARADYLKKLQGLEANPDTFAASPMFQKKLDFGLESLQRRLGASGQTGSGAEKAALFDYGGRTMFDEYNKERDRLAGWAGAGHFSNPADMLRAQTDMDKQNASMLSGGGNAATNVVSDIIKFFI